MNTEELGTILRGLGFNLNEEQISIYINSNDLDESGKIDFPTFHKIVSVNQHPVPMRGPPEEEEVLKNFSVFDTYKNGMIPAADLVYILGELGEPLTTEDINHLLR